MSDRRLPLIHVTLALGTSVYEPADPMGKMFFNIVATFAEFEVSLPGHLDETIQSKIMAMVFSMAAEVERGLISARTKEALRARRASCLSDGRKALAKASWTSTVQKSRRCSPTVHPEVHREALQFFACQLRKLDEEARSQETEAVKSHGGFCTFEPLGPIRPKKQLSSYAESTE